MADSDRPPLTFPIDEGGIAFESEGLFRAICAVN